MADYWKSQARKFCDFCKCWIADNKPSIQYHENGKRHKENVSKKLSEMVKRSAKQHKENAKLDNDMKKMEEEALKAYMKDIQSSADFTSQNLRDKLSEEECQRLGMDNSEEEKKRGEKKPTKSVEQKTRIDSNFTPKPRSPWYEGKSEGGFTYYWNIDTSESRWEKPEEGYMSLAEQEKVTETQTRGAHKEEGPKSVEKAEEVRAYQQRESMKNLRQVKQMRERQEEEEKQKKEAEEVADLVVGPKPRVDPYGGWTTVQRIQPKELDLQLPKSKYTSARDSYHIQMVEQIEQEERRPKFTIKEKVLQSLEADDENGDAGTVSFKKRKLNSANFRRRKDSEENNEDDD